MSNPDEHLAFLAESGLYPLTLEKVGASPNGQALFIEFTMFACRDATERSLRSVADVVEQILRRRGRGEARVAIKVEGEYDGLGRNPMSCLAYYSQQTALDFRRLMLSTVASGYSSKDGFYWQWG